MFSEHGTEGLPTAVPGLYHEVVLLLLGVQTARQFDVATVGVHRKHPRNPLRSTVVGKPLGRET